MLFRSRARYFSDRLIGFTLTLLFISLGLGLSVAASLAWVGEPDLAGSLTSHAAIGLCALVAFGVGALALHAIPSRPLRSLEGAHPFHALRFVREDRLFRQALIAWMLMGFANLMMLPLGVESLANEKHGLARSADQIAMLTVVIPNVARLCLSPVWGWLFDRMNFFALRATLNVGFALGILGFFTSDSTPGLVASAIIYGVSNAGGDVAWGLWVTKFAPADRVADYMSVHTFLTGVRGVIAPFAAFQAIRHWSLAALGWISAAFIVAASLLLLPEALRSVRGRKAEPPTEEIQD